MSRDDQQYINAISFAQSGTNRSKVIKVLGDKMRMPSQIAKALDLRVNQVSATLTELKNENLVICLNEEKRRGRLYKLTDLGLEVYEFLTDDE